MSTDLDLEDRYRRVLRLLPGYYRDKWEEDMVAAFLDSRQTGDVDEDVYVILFGRPTWQEIASVVGLAARLYLGGAAAPRRYFAWGQAIRCAVLAVLLVQAVRGLDELVLTAWSRHIFSWLPAPPSSLVVATPGGALPPWVWYVVAYAWIVAFVVLVLGRYRLAQAIAALAIVPDLVVLLQGQVTGRLPAPYVGPWAFFFLLHLAPVLAMTAFHRDAPPAARWPWLLALPANYLLVVVPLVALDLTGNSGWVPDFSGLYCILVSLACLAHVPRVWFRQADTGVWSLTLMLLAADAGAYRLFSIGDYLHNPHLIRVSLAELLILLVAVALIFPDAARAQSATPASPPYPQPE